MANNPADTVLARRHGGDLRVLVRVGTRHWPELADRILVYLLDGVNESSQEIPVYLPDADQWITVSVDTLGHASTKQAHTLTAKPTRAQVDRAQEDVQLVLGARVRVMRTSGRQGVKR
jgi:hypothetical protein